MVPPQSIAPSANEESMKGINEALAATQTLIAESGPVREPVAEPEPGPIDEKDREVFEISDKRMAALQIQVKDLKNAFRKMEDGPNESNDS
jgi:hypothetical protein